MSAAISIINPEVAANTTGASSTSVANWSPKSYGTAGETTNTTTTSAPVVVPPGGLRKGNLPDDVTKREAVEKSLWWWNLSCAIAHLVQAAAALIIGKYIS